MNALKAGYEEALHVRGKAFESVFKLENDFKTAQAETSDKEGLAIKAAEMKQEIYQPSIQFGPPIFKFPFYKFCS